MPGNPPSDRRPPQDKWPAIFAAMRAVDLLARGLDFDSRITLFCGLLTQEICTLPYADRHPELDRLIADLPGIFRSTENGMQQALTENARKGL